MNFFEYDNLLTLQRHKITILLTEVYLEFKGTIKNIISNK